VEAGVDDEAAGAEEFFVELAEEESVSGVALFLFLLSLNLSPVRPVPTCAERARARVRERRKIS